jgi:hypothetical protein
MRSLSHLFWRLWALNTLMHGEAVPATGVVFQLLVLMSLLSGR